MIVKKETEHLNDIPANFERHYSIDTRWGEERRKEPSDGFTYISSVGWIDRRERLRRKDDPDNF
jgi:hypothetical protein